ncbi:MAG: hypothetical protein NVSMB29_16700 [Candidatus Dormibacteria bacterium]
MPPRGGPAVPYLMPSVGMDVDQRTVDVLLSVGVLFGCGVSATDATTDGLDGFAGELSRDPAR